MIFRKLLEVAPPSASRAKPAPNDTVWHLTLDQIESGSGQIVNRVYGPASESGSSTFAFDNENVLYSKLRPYLNKVICPDTKGIATTELVPLRPIPSELNREYLCSYLRSPEFVSWASAQVDGAKMPRMKMKSFWAYEIPVPSLDDQKRIAHLLGKVEGLIAQRKQHLQQLDDLFKSVFLEMFGDPITNPRKFPVRKLSEFYINPKEGTKCGPFGSALKKDELVESGIPVWNMDNIDPAGRMVLPFRMWITEKKYKELSSYSVIDGDIIISRAGTVGKMCVARMNGEPAIISTNLIRLRLGDKLRPLHVVSLMTYCKGRVGRLKTGADGAFTHMNTGILDKLEFPYPPTELQDQFAAIVEKVERLKSRYQQSLTDLESLYGALSQKAFKGELDLSRVPLEPVTSSDRDSFESESTTSEAPFGATDKSAEFSPEGRRDFLKQCFTNWLATSSSGNLSFSDFLQEVQLDSIHLWGEDDFIAELTLAEYDLFKEWLFEAIDTGQIEQTRNTIIVDGEPDFGNQIVLRRRDYGD